MEQDRWVKESEPKRKNYMFIVVLGLMAAAIIGVTVFSCGETKVEKLFFDKGFSTLHVDETDKLYVTIQPSGLQPELIWKSTDESVVTVIDGVVTGKKPGKATVTATVISQADISAECEYVVEEQDVDMETLDILEEPVVLRPGGHQQMNVRVTPENQNEQILWSSSDESVVRVNSRGKVEAVKVGVAYVFAESERTSVRDTAMVSVEGPGTMPNIASDQASSSVSGPVSATASAAPKSVTAPKQTQASGPTPKSATPAKQVQTAKPAQKDVAKTVPAKTVPAKSAPTQSAKPVQTTKPIQTAKPVSKAPAKASTSGLKNLGYAHFRGSWPNDVNGRMEFSSTHVIDSKDPKGRMASPGDYVIGEWADGHLVQGIWYGSDNQVKGSILIGK